MLAGTLPRSRTATAGLATAIGLAFTAALLPGCGRVPPSSACERFVACIRSLDAQRGTSTNAFRYESQGGCWGSTEGAELCTTSCVRGVELLERTYPGVCPSR